MLTALALAAASVAQPLPALPSLSAMTSATSQGKSEIFATAKENKIFYSGSSDETYPIYAFKMPKKAEYVAYFDLTAPGMFGPRGYGYVDRKGSISGSLAASVSALKVIVDGKGIPLKVTKDGGFFGDSEFTIGEAELKSLRALPDDSYAYFYYQNGSDHWRPFEIRPLKKPGRIRIGDLRDAYKWATGKSW